MLGSLSRMGDIESVTLGKWYSGKAQDDELVNRPVVESWVWMMGWLVFDDAVILGASPYRSLQELGEIAAL